MAALMQRCPRWSCRAVRFTREDLIFGRACAFARRQWQRIRLPMGRFADLARRRACLRWSGTWTASPRPRELPGYAAKKTRFAEENKNGSRKKGIGIAAFLHGAGFTGSGERYLNSLVGVEADADGKVRVLVSS